MFGAGGGGVGDRAGCGCGGGCVDRVCSVRLPRNRARPRAI